MPRCCVVTNPDGTQAVRVDVAQSDEKAQADATNAAMALWSALGNKGGHTVEEPTINEVGGALQ